MNQPICDAPLQSWQIDVLDCIDQSCAYDAPGARADTMCASCEPTS
jgi:hypothetical protein